MTLITTRFDIDSTAAEVAEGINLKGRRAIVTGGASGIGIETARALASTGADVTLAVRDFAAGQTVARDIVTSTGNTAVHVGLLDLTDRGSIKEFAESWWGPLHILVNNAGVMACPEAHTADGWELQFATNHLGHFALALGLQEALAVDGNARIVSVSSSAHGRSPVVFDDIHFEEREYEPWHGLRAVQDRQRALRRRGYAPLGEGRHHRQRAHARRHHDEPAAPHRTRGDGGVAGVRAQGRDGRSRRPSRARRHRCCLPPRPSWKASAAGTLTTATRPRLSRGHGRALGVRDYAVDPQNARRLWDASLAMLESQLSAAA